VWLVRLQERRCCRCPSRRPPGRHRRRPSSGSPRRCACRSPTSHSSSAPPPARPPLPVRRLRRLGGGGGRWWRGCVPSRQHHLAHRPLRILLPHAEWGGNPAFVRTLHEGLQRGSAGNPGGVAFLTMVNAAWLEMLEHLLYTALLHGGIKVRRPRSGMRCGAASPSPHPSHPAPTRVRCSVTRIRCSVTRVRRTMTRARCALTHA
jgi:hypothetical protein